MIPANLRASHETRLRAQTLLFGSLGICVFVLAIGVTVISSGIFGASLFFTLLTVVALGLLPYMQYRSGSYRLPAGLLIAFLVVTMPMYCVLLGAFPVPALLAFPIVPLIAAFFLGRVLGLVSAVVLAGAAVVLGSLLPLPDPALLGSLSDIFVVMGATMTLTSAQLAWVYEGARKRAEQDLVTLNFALERAKQTAESANRSKTEFLRYISHELRTPLNSILGHGEMLREELSESGQVGLVADVARISDASQHILGLINELLDISRIEAGAVDLRLTEVDLTELLHSVAEAIRPLASTRQIEVKLALAADLPTVVTDARRLRQVLLNLVSNACKFTERGAVTIGAVPHGDAVDAVELWVRDTGIGMSARQLAEIFEPFVQVDLSIERRDLGSGLGLSISRRLVEILGGRITVTSEPGQGSEFRVSIPRAAAPALAASAAPPAS